MWPKHVVILESGSVVIIVAVAAVALFGFAALAIDGGYLMVAQQELQNAADAAAHAGALELGRVYDEVLDPYANITRISNHVRSFSNRTTGNTGYGDNENEIEIMPDDIKVCHWNKATGACDASLVPANAVQVTARRSDLANHPVSMFFAGILGKGLSQVSLEATAIAALTPLKNAGCAPFGVAEEWLTLNTCGSGNITIGFNGSSVQNCGGWNACGDNPNKPNIVPKITALGNGSLTCSCTPGKTSLPFTTGTITPAFDELEKQYDANKDATNKWDIPLAVPIFEGNCSSSSSVGNKLITGYAIVAITDVRPTGPAGHEMDVIWKCAQDGDGGGTGDGTLSTHPKFVQQ